MRIMSLKASNLVRSLKTETVAFAVVNALAADGIPPPVGVRIATG